MKDSIKTTLIIATYNWEEALELVLLSLLAQSEKPHEVIFADDGSTDATKKLINSFKKKFSFPLVHLWQEDRGFEKSKILNQAINKASGNYIIQIDGDVILHKDFIKDHRVNATKGMFVSGTRVLLGKNISKSLLKNKSIEVNFFTEDITNKHYTLRIPLLTSLFKAPSSNSKIVIRSVRGCNMSFWKSDLIRINGYDENMTGWGREDSEISARLINTGVKKMNLKFSGIQYHLYHPILSKDRLTINDIILKNTITENRKFATNGIHKIKKGIVQKRKKLSVIIPTLNEEVNIVSAIQSVLFADEIILIDSLSSDKTVTLAKELGAKIILRKFDDFSTQKNYAISQCSHDWVLALDADERITEKLQEEILHVLQFNDKAVAYSMNLDYYFMDKLMKHGEFQTKKSIRLFHKDYCQYDGSLVHEQLLVKGQVGKLKHSIKHESFKNINAFIQTQNFYAELKAKQLTKQPNVLAPLSLIFKPPFRFFKHYILRLGILDGYQGYVFAKIQGYGVFLRYLKLRVLKKNRAKIAKKVRQTLPFLIKGKSILYPTDTVWGIGCDATNEKAVKNIYAIKKREESKSMIILVHSLEMLQRIVHTIPQKVIAIIQDSTEPTSIIYSNPKGLAHNLIAKDNTVAIRIVQDEFCRQLIQAFGKPIVSTSANISTGKTPKSYAAIQTDILDNVDYIVDLYLDQTNTKSSRILRIAKDDSIEILRD